MGEIMREKGRTWASDASESHVLMGRVFQYLEGLLRVQSPRKGGTQLP